MATHAKKRRWKKILFSIFIIILIILGIIVGMLYSKFSNLNIREIDETDLGLNDNLYTKVSDTLTESEYRNVKNFVLFGIDTQGHGDGQNDSDFIGRSDTIMIVSINPKYKSIKLISIPRDTYVDVEGIGKTKINHAYAYGGVQLALKTINQNFGLNITDYATVDFAGLMNVINDIDGINLYITEEEMYFINNYLKDLYGISDGAYEKLYSYGNVRLNGEQAVTHARNREVGDGDFERARRQREVIEAIFDKISKKDASEIYNLIDVLFREVTTNINVTEYMGTLAEVLLNKNMYLQSVISAQVPKKAEHKIIDGIYYYVPTDMEQVKEDMLEYIYKK